MKVSMGADHGGVEIKDSVKDALVAHGIEVQDEGAYDRTSVDYPDYATVVARRVAAGEVDWGVLVCTTGLGMSITANRFSGVRAALCMNTHMAKMAREHNDANILVLAGGMTDAETVTAILDTWLNSDFKGDRHTRRIGKLESYTATLSEIATIQQLDPELHKTIAAEIERQQSTVNLIASENHVSRAVREAQGCVMTNKYAEGYPGKRWYNGCDFVDAAETLAIERAKALFGADHANVQPHCGSSANMAVYFSVLEPGDTILAMSLAHGGHLTHGNPANFSGRLFNIVSYGVSRDTEQIDYDELERLAHEHKPKLIVAGASAYPRILDFERFRTVADAVDALLMVDMAHIAGLVAAGVHPNPVPHAQFVTTTTHKTLRGPRSGMILCQKAFAKKIDHQIFPGTQGGPQMHTIAAKAVCFREAALPAFKAYGQRIVDNAQTMADALQHNGCRLISGGTENHLMLVDLTEKGITGKDAADALDRAGIILNKNAIPFDAKSPFVTSGIRIGTPSVATRGMGGEEMKTIARWIGDVLAAPEDEALIKRTRAAVRELCAAFPAP